MQGKINKSCVDSLRPGQFVADIETKGFSVRKLKSGTASYGLRYRNREGKQRWLALGLHGQITPDQARTLAKQRMGEVAAGEDPVAKMETARTVEKNSVNAVLDAFIKRHARGQGLRIADRIERVFERLVRPRLGDKSIYQLKRRDLIEQLDTIEDANGAAMADQVLAYLRKAFTWWAGRDEDFSSPIVPGMRRAKRNARTRILNDEEIRDVWQALNHATVPPCYASLTRVLLLTGQRRDEVAGMHVRELAGDVWTIPASRYKVKIDHEVPLTKTTLALLPQSKPFVFSITGGRKPFVSFSRCKAAVDAAIAHRRKAEGREAMMDWRVHDLRRTARSLMSRAGVPSDHAERVIGHRIGGVRGIYDRHEFAAEKRAALEKLAALIDRILNPAANVVNMRRPAETERRHS